jgi:hypothetical protein
VSCVGGSRVLDFRCNKIPKHFPYTLCAFPLLGLGSRVLDFRCCKLCKCFPYVYQLDNDICVNQLKNGFLSHKKILLLLLLLFQSLLMAT